MAANLCFVCMVCDGTTREAGHEGRHGTQEQQPTCDVCGRAQGNSPNVLRDDQPGDWNGETGNHLSCEALEKAQERLAEEVGSRCASPEDVAFWRAEVARLGG